MKFYIFPADSDNVQLLGAKDMEAALAYAAKKYRAGFVAEAGAVREF